MTVPICRRGHRGPRRWWPQSSHLVFARISELVLQLPRLCLQMSFDLSLPNLAALLFWTTLKCVWWCLCVHSPGQQEEVCLPLLLKCRIWSPTLCCMSRWKRQCGRNCTNHTKWIAWYAKTKMESSLLHIWFSYDLRCIAFGAVVITLAAVWQGKLI